MIELHAAMPEEAISAYPVATGTLDARRWTQNSQSARRMMVEYCKYLAILTREAVLGLDGGVSAKG
jgi:hypothetical protein